MKFYRLLDRIKRFLKSRKTWKKPNQADVLFFDSFESDFVLSYIKNNQVAIVDSNKVICIPILLKSLFSGRRYEHEFANAVSPKVCITCLDNDTSFWELQSLFPDVTAIIIQFGWRGELADCFGTLKRNKQIEKYKVDYILAFNQSIGNKYLEYIDGKVIQAGSIKNNYYSKTNAVALRTLTFISQFRPKQNSHPVFFYEGEQPFYWEVFYEAESLLLPLLSRYCKDNGIQLRICGYGFSPDEYQFFVDRMIGGTDWDFIPRYRPGSNYNLLDRSTFVVTVDCTLGYEALGRGIKTAFFSSRWSSLQNDSYHFGWPAHLPESGPFWASHVNEKEVKRILDFMLSASNSEWEEVRQKYVEEVMVYDPENTRLVQLLKKLGVPLADEA